MDVRGGGERNGSVGSKDEGTSSKWHTSFEEYEDDDADRRANISTQVEIEKPCAEMETTYRSEYRPKGSGYEYSGSGSESVDTELEFSDECVGMEDREGSSRERRRRSIVMPTVEVLCR